MKGYVVTLSTGKKVRLAELKIKHQNLALQAVGNKAKDNQALMGNMAQQELLKILLVDIDGKVPSQPDREDLDKLFNFQEYGQLLQVLQKVSGGSEQAGEPQIDFDNSGEQ